MIAFTQPLRLGDSLLTPDGAGVVEEIGLVYTLHPARGRLPARRPELETEPRIPSGTPRSSVAIAWRRSPCSCPSQPISSRRSPACAPRCPPSGSPTSSSRALAERATITVRAHADDPQRAERARPRSSPLDARGAPRRRSVRVTPPPSRRGRGGGPQRTPRANVPQRRRARRRARSRRRRRVPLLLLVVFVSLVALLAGVGFTGAAIVLSNCQLSDLKPPGTNANSFIYARDGSLLGSIPSEENRTPVQRSEMSPWLAKATVAIEDRRFYHHGGIDPHGIVRALWKDIGAGKVVEGGSTITQQLVRNLYLDPAERTHEPKAQGDLPRQQARGRQALAEGQDPHRVHEPGLLRQSCRTASRRRRRRTSRFRRRSSTSRSPRSSPASRRRRPTRTRSSTSAARPRGATRCSTRC